MNIITTWLIALTMLGFFLFGVGFGGAITSERYKASPTWGCEAQEYVGPTGGNHAVYPSEWEYWKFLGWD